MIDVPKDIEQYLGSDEVVEKEFKLDKQQTAYASTRRLFLKKSNTVKDIDYSHISSIQFKSYPDWFVVLAGILSVAVGHFMQQNSVLGWALIFAGVVLVIAGSFFYKQQQVELSVEGLSSVFAISGHKGTLNLLFKHIREREESNGRDFSTYIPVVSQDNPQEVHHSEPISHSAISTSEDEQ